MAIIYPPSAAETKYYPSYRLLDGQFGLAFGSLQDLLGSQLPAFGAGSVWEAEGVQFIERDLTSVDYHVITAQGVRLRLQPGPDGQIPITALGALPTPVADLGTASAFNIRETLAQAIEIARELGGVAYIPAGDWQLSGATLRTTAGDVRIRCSDAATIHTLPAEFSTR
ncbi:hypothetical protein, partial [Pseudooceanicola marinus]|uniref:hypothetical protein n=1 Tax=Pseudooceanicola marinus TaxID=396013 RepID=UPI001CD1B062